MKKQILTAAAIVLGLGLSSAANAQVRQSFQGSDTLAGVMTDALAASGMESQLTYVGGGSTNGEKAILNGEQGLAPMSREVKKEVVESAKAQGVEFIPHVIGLDGVGVFVNRSNAIDRFDFATLRDIFTCKTTQWQQVPGSRRTGEIKAFRRNDVSGTTDTFKTLVGIKEFGACVKVLAETVDVAHATESIADAIGYSGLSAKRDNNHAAPLAKAAGDAAVEPTTATVRDGSYPLARKLFVYEVSGTRKPSTAETAFLGYLTDRSFLDPIIQDNEFITLD